MLCPENWAERCKKAHAPKLRDQPPDRGGEVETGMASARVSLIAPELTVVQCVLQQPSKLCIYFVCFLKLGLF